MRILVTGVTGRVGSRFVPRLAETEPSPSDLRVLVRDPEAVAPFWDRGIDVVVGDLRDPDTVKRAVAGMDAVVHLAAAFRGVDEAETIAVNRESTIDLGRAAIADGVRRFVYASTTLVYGPGRGRPAHEDDETAPGHPYPQSKAAAERALLDLHHDAGLGLRIVRLAFVYGDGDPHLAEWLPRAAAGPAHQRMQTVHHADVAEGLLLALHKGADGRIYNLADDAALTVAELSALASLPAPAVTGDADPWTGIADTSRIRTELGYRPTVPSVYAAYADGRA
jgi:nucleoside-diphosphate-sugar epimerase